ncbi:MAG: tail fiber domain-containing protein, partial [Rhodocyclaceae bacterium]
ANGLIARTADGAAATRTITGTANQVIVTNGDGAAGNPTLSLPQSITTTSTPLFAGVGVNGAAASFRLLQFYTGGVPRINVGTDGAGESGANAGSNFQINRFDDAGNSLGAALFIQRSTGNVRLNAYGAGTLQTDSSGNVTASSDASLKTVTGSFTRGLDDVLKLTPRTYHWNVKSGMDTDDENVGFIAQEVLEAIPEAVGQYRTSEVVVDGKKTKKREKAELLTLSDRPIIAALVNAVKELSEQNAALVKRIAALEMAKK